MSGLGFLRRGDRKLSIFINVVRLGHFLQNDYIHMPENTTGRTKNGNLVQLADACVSNILDVVVEPNLIQMCKGNLFNVSVTDFLETKSPHLEDCFKFRK